MGYKGRYRIKNPSKYRGNPTQCIFRSLWERKFMKYCDMNDNVLAWSSEEVRVPYISPLDGRRHTYYVDFWMRVLNKNGKERCYLVEIKPESQTRAPVLKEGKKPTRTQRTQMMTYLKNVRKWESARDYAENRGWKFVIITEKTLFGGKKPRNK